MHAVAMLLLGIGVIGVLRHQLGARRDTEWTWLPGLLLVVTLPLSFQLHLIGVTAFALSGAILRMWSRPGSVMLVTGAVAFLVGVALHGPFWSQNDPEPGVGISLALFASGLVLIVAGWLTIGLTHSRELS
ncbi:MAG: hypothetical protein M3198_12465 [Actinomycetota bacterium]|nr:hypothetical protein [Actinomycetota bacterium]